MCPIFSFLKKIVLSKHEQKNPPASQANLTVLKCAREFVADLKLKLPSNLKGLLQRRKGTYESCPILSHTISPSNSLAVALLDFKLGVSPHPTSCMQRRCFITELQFFLDIPYGRVLLQKWP